jgi:DNA-binding SARP family transcriptional activator
VVAGVETRVESDPPGRTGSRRGLRVGMLGALTITREGVPVALPPSRKARALLAYLALAPHAMHRSHLCELLWDVPNDPRGELRWCLSKLRAALDEPGRRRIETSGDSITLDLCDCFVDAIEVAHAMQAGIETLAPERLRTLFELFAGDFLEGLEIERSPEFGTWLVAQRRRFRAGRTAILEHSVKGLPVGADEAFPLLEQWLQLAPFDQSAHVALLDAFARRGRVREAEEHLASAARLFDAEGLGSRPLREAWRNAQARQTLTVRAVEQTVAGPIAIADDANGPLRRASIAVMPFLDPDGRHEARGGLADGLAHDIITRLAKLRTLFVIGQGTVFALQERRIGADEAGRTLSVDYTASGSLHRRGERLILHIELTDARTARIVWAESFDSALDDAFLVLDAMVDRIVASIASEIETVERNRALLKPPSSLDAWGAFHRGLWHVYRYSKADNEIAQNLFGRAVALDPTFARAHAALSFTHFQNAFQRWTEREPEIERAFATAGQSLVADDRDPAAHWAMGRAHWLRQRHDQAIVELQSAVDLSPSFAHGHYTLAFVHAQAGDPLAAIGASDLSRQLSPFDPLLFGMLGTRAMALTRLGQFDEAADWAVKAAARPNAFSHILAIAAHCLALAGRHDEARAHLESIRKTVPNYRVDDFLATFQFAPELEGLFRQAAKRLGIG